MNTRQLRHFLAVLDRGSLSAAARVVHLSLPALSRSLRSLEDELRVPLFDRQDRRLRPTPYALMYAERARRIVFDEREGARSLALMRDGESGSLHFGMGSSIARMLMAPMLLQLLSDAPRLRLSTVVQSTDALLAALRREELDFFIGDIRAVAHDSQMQVQPVYRCSFGWYARRGHPLDGRENITIDALRTYPLIGSGYADEGLLEQMAALYGLSRPLQDHFSVNTNDASTLLTLLLSSNAIAPATDVSVFTDLRDGTLVCLDVNPPLSLQLTLGIVERAGRTRVPAAERAFEIVRAHFASVEQAVAPRVPRARARRKVAGKNRTRPRIAR
ncbi:LysR family transcriptional regulator [Bradyrhizobium jicamae]|uniref:LysR family transcriptional regulator n=1 Tax=Bradyrhizobium jicamae TaxID=280332 RepID=A0ABS5FTJ8_9BRAD|nr:LysR family transcriptional regulator [Bradyrhizobium jicamae]MBR0800065.1 LysR family transcriptional regulator [Bradyrhizobium jicamae]MBR0933943.1 LysR family transcriptional regulator [Bradyrhizobium jicamae]